MIGKYVVFETKLDDAKGKLSAINVQDAELQKMQELKDALEDRERVSRKLEEALNASKKELQQSEERAKKAAEDGHKNIRVFMAHQQADKVTLEQEALKKDELQKECKKLDEELGASKRHRQEENETMQQKLQALAKDSLANLEKWKERQSADERENQTLRVQIRNLEQEALKKDEQLQALTKEHKKELGKYRDSLKELKERQLAAEPETESQFQNFKKQAEAPRTGKREHQEEKKTTQQKPQAQQHRCDQADKDLNHDNDKPRESRKCYPLLLVERPSWKRNQIEAQKSRKSPEERKSRESPPKRRRSGHRSGDAQTVEERKSQARPEERKSQESQPHHERRRHKRRRSRRKDHYNDAEEYNENVAHFRP